MRIQMNGLVRLGSFKSTDERQGKVERLTRATQYSLSYSQSAEASMPLCTKVFSSPNSCISMVSHIGLMPDVWVPKRIVLGHMEGSGVRGRNQQQWVDYVREDLQLIVLSLT